MGKYLGFGVPGLPKALPFLEISTCSFSIALLWEARHACAGHYICSNAPQVQEAPGSGRAPALLRVWQQSSAVPTSQLWDSWDPSQDPQHWLKHCSGPAVGRWLPTQCEISKALEDVPETGRASLSPGWMEVTQCKKS